RHAAIRVALEHDLAGQPLSYRVWYQLLCRDGLAVAGANPEATFLTAIKRSPLVRSTHKRGTVVVDVSLLDELRAERERLLAIQRQLVLDLPTGGPLADQQRTLRDLARVERALAEATVSLDGTVPAAEATARRSRTVDPG